ncbi:MAG: N-acetylmuramoyl-L-alanine amidase, partial [Candidatus Aminicenantes bacterium]
MSIHKQFLGMVRKGKFYILAPLEHQDLPVGAYRLTRIQRIEARPPEPDEIDLSDYENRVIVVNGEAESDWIYTAHVAEEAGPVLSNFLEIYFSREEREKKLCVLVIGHHPDKPGGMNPRSNTSEFEFNKKLAPLIERHIQKVRVQKLFYKSYESLPQDINDLDPDFVISLHCNYYDNVQSGTEVIYFQDDQEGKQ